ncbi:MAG: carboxypeptidase-like regulatory domain-containing protein, partial [Byssovorax sp.]
MKILMRPGVSVVVEATTPDGAPAAKTEFRLERRGHSGSVAFRRSGVTGADGHLRFNDLPPAVSASLEMGASTWAWDEHARRVTLAASGETTVRVTLDRGRTLSGRVTDADTKAPIEGASVGMGWGIKRAVVTDTEGRYTLEGWTGNGIHDVHVRAPGYGRGQANVEAASVLDFELSKGDAVVGRVLGPDGSPVAGAVVAAVGSTYRENVQTMSTADGATSADGRFALTGLRRDLSHTLVVMAPGCGRTLLDFDPRAGGPGTIDLGDVLLPTGRTLSGRVLRQDGSSVAAAQLQLEGANADRGRLRPGAGRQEDFGGYGSREEATSGEDGRFAFLDLAPGTYELDVWTPGMPSLKPTVKIGSDADPAPLELRFPEGRSIHVTVVDDDGKPVPWAYVLVEGGSGPHNTVSSLDAAGSTSLLVPDTVASITV